MCSYGKPRQVLLRINLNVKGGSSFNPHSFFIVVSTTKTRYIYPVSI